MKRSAASAARLKLRRILAEMASAIAQLLAAKLMVEGSFVSLGRRCGNPNCKCAKGEKHVSKYLSRSIDGKTKLVFVRNKDEVDISRKAESYRIFRQARADLMKLAAQAAQVADDLQKALTEPYPPNKEKSGAMPRKTKSEKDHAATPSENVR
jgi:hypothetical protein